MSDSQNPAIGRVTTRTKNWIPTKEGFLKTWQGSKKLIKPEDQTPGHAGNNGPVAWDDKYVQDGVFFTDTFGRRRLVVAVDKKVYVVEGNTAELIFQFPDNTYAGDRDSVRFLPHSNHVIILHPNFPPLKWGGDEPVSWLGVRDIPTQCEVHTAGTWGNYFESTHTWGMSTAGYRPPVYLQHDDAVEPETRGYSWKAAYMNSRGQIGRWGASTYVEIPPTQGNTNHRWHPIVEWRRPTDQGPDFMTPSQVGNPTGNGTDITHTVLARTGNTIADPEAGIFFVQGIYPYTQNRTTDQTADAGLSVAITIDDNPAPNASFGCVYKGYVFLSGNLEDPNGVWWSKPNSMESWPTLNYHKTATPVTAILAMSDRVVVVTEESIEVLRETSTGLFALFRKEEGKGAKLGSTMQVVKDSIFGIFNEGFGIFDGFAYKGMADEFGEFFDFISLERNDITRSHIDYKGRYWCTLNVAGQENNSKLGSLYMFDFTLNAWFNIEEDVTAIFSDESQLYFGGRDNIRIAGAGDGGLESVLEFAPSFLERQNPMIGLLSKEILDIYIRTSSTGDYSCTVKCFTDEMNTEPIAEGTLSLNLGRPALTDAITDSLWDEAVLGDNDTRWDGPRYSWQKVRLDNPVEWYSIRLQITSPQGAHVEVSGLAMDIALEKTQSPL